MNGQLPTPGLCIRRLAVIRQLPNHMRLFFALFLCCCCVFACMCVISVYACGDSLQIDQKKGSLLIDGQPMCRVYLAPHWEVQNPGLLT